MVVYEKYVLKHAEMTNRFDKKIILHNYMLYLGELSYVGIFKVD